MRGAMNFDDYNYASINKHVLIGNMSPIRGQDSHTCKDKDGKDMDMEFGHYDQDEKEAGFFSPTDKSLRDNPDKHKFTHEIFDT
jgi:hypothetical protein